MGESLSKVKLSVIIPAYNMQEYICKCIDSLKDQAEVKIEIVVVNDGSKDGTLSVVQQYQREHTDLDIRIVNQENQGLYHARTNGISYATGDYVAFCDADDYVDENFYQVALKKMLETDADVLHFGMRKVRNGDVLQEFPLKDAEYCSETAVQNLFEKINFTVSNCDKIYRRCLFDGLVFDEDLRKYEEDKLVNVKVLSRAKTVVTISDVGYNYETREGSITTTNSGLGYLDVLKTNVAVFSYIKDHLPAARQAAAYDYCAHLAYCYNYCHAFGGNDITKREILQKFKALFREERLGEYTSYGASRKRRNMMRLMRICPKLGAMLYKCMVRAKNN